MWRLGLYGDTDALLARARHPARNAWRADLLEWCGAHREDRPLPDPELRFFHGSSELYLEECQAATFNFFLAARLTGHREWAEAGAAWLSAIAAVPPETHPGHYALGAACLGLANGLEFGAPFLSHADHDRAEASLARIVPALAAAAMDSRRAWCAGCHLCHDHWIPTAGYGLGALALVQRGSESRAALARQARDAIVHAMDLAGPDGSWPEGPADWVYGLFPVLLFADAWRAATGESLYDHAWLRSTGFYRLYCWLAEDRYVVIGDSFPSGRYDTMGSASCHLLDRLAAEYRSPVLQWLADRDATADLSGRLPGVIRTPNDWLENPPYLHARMHCVGWRVLWRDVDLQPEPPNGLPHVGTFPNAGLVVARGGWMPGQPVLTFTCGPVAGEAARTASGRGEQVSALGISHAHAQSGHFTLDWDGPWIVSPSYGRAADRFHNVPLVSGQAQVFDAAHGGRLIAAEAAGDCHVLVGDLTPAYSGGSLQRLVRTLLWWEPGVVAVRDFVEASLDYARVVQQQFHVPAGAAVDILPGPTACVYRADERDLWLAPLAPRGAGLELTTLHGRTGRELARRLDVVWAFDLRSRDAYATALAVTPRGAPCPIRRLAATGAIAATIRGGAAGIDERTAVFVDDPGNARWEVQPARAGRHIVLGLPPGTRWSLEGNLERRPVPTDEGPQYPPESEHALVAGLRPGGDMAATEAGAWYGWWSRAAGGWGPPLEDRA